MKGSGMLVLRGVLAVPVVAFAIAQASDVQVAAAQSGVMAPVFEVDPFWPQPLSFPYVLGSVNGLAIDSRDHVFIVHGGLATLIGRTEAGSATDPITGDCCSPTQPVMEYDPQGNLVREWGGEGQGYTWPQSVNGIALDPQGNLWIGGIGDGDSQILKFSREGQLIAQFGQPGAAVNVSSRTGFNRPAGFAFNAAANEAYVADSGNRRVAVVDISSGEIKRFFGAYGNAPSADAPAAYSPTGEPSQQFGSAVSCVALSSDDLLYVCDRTNNRIQVFRPDGTFVREAVIARSTLGPGAVWDVAFSPDAQQRYLYVADGHNMKVHVLDRQSLQVISDFGRGGRYPGHFFGIHSVATDSRGNVFTVETYHGKRVQRFNLVGSAPGRPGQFNPAWPASALQ